ncbi:MAG: class I SAM-dependent methyltransferase [Bacillota bacterium]|nr:class I SAM-dependent methyltransferase [Bacillota bacterium]
MASMAGFDREQRGAELTPGEGSRSGKQAYVEAIFDRIAPRYDRMNRLMTLGLWWYWQWSFRRLAGIRPGDRVLDVGCGTAELSLLAARETGPGGRVTGVDIAEGMLRVCRQKIAGSPLAGRLEFLRADAQALPFPDGSFDVVVSGFMLRNVASLDRALGEMARVLRPGGRVAVLELTHPPSRWVAAPYLAYFRHVVPWLGRWARREGDPLPPYAWLPESLREIPPAPELARRLERAGFSRVAYRYLSAGVVAVHTGEKPGRRERGARPPA